jgi:hypothetical protein
MKRTTFASLILTGGLTGLAMLAVAAEPAAPPVPARGEGPPKPWKEMTGPQRAKYMKDVVTPQMKVAFQKFDADEFGKFGCDTCHGKDAKARKFKMPNPDIYALPSTPAGFAPLLEKKADMMKFMGETVKPRMAALLGLPEFDPRKPEAGGFGCIACHTIKKE